MKKYFGFDLHGRDWWRPYLIFWIVFLVFYIATMTISVWAPSLRLHPGLSVVLTFVFVAIILIAELIFLIVALRIIVPKLSIDGKSFAFQGTIGRYLGINVVGYLLTIVTLTIYAPWFARRVVSYLVSQTSFSGSTPEFLGKGGKLFVYMLLAFWLPLVVLGVAAGLILAVALNGQSVSSGATAWVVASIWIVVFLIMIPLSYLLYKWYINIRWNGRLIRWQTHFWPSCGFILGQALLTLITVGVYWPAAWLRIYRYFAERTVLTAEETEVGRLGFEGSIGRGFGLLWGQTLLSIVTVGVYAPWAAAAIGRWLLGSTYYQPTTAA